MIFDIQYETISIFSVSSVIFWNAFYFDGFCSVVFSVFEAILRSSSPFLTQDATLWLHSDSGSALVLAPRKQRKNGADRSGLRCLEGLLFMLTN